MDTFYPLALRITGAIFGQGANDVVVYEEQDNYASTHDLRSAFGTRWASSVMPAALQQTMRHASFESTLKYYVKQNSNMIAKEIWKKDAQRAACRNGAIADDLPVDR